MKAAQRIEGLAHFNRHLGCRQADGPDATSHQGVGSSPMSVNPCAGRIESRHALSDQAADDAAEHIARARTGQAGVARWVGTTAAIGVCDERI